MLLHPKKIFVIDNFSKDRTYEILKTYKNVIIEQRRCNRGMGRNIALRKLLRECNNTDHIICIDLDSIYTKAYCKEIIRKRRHLIDGELYLGGYLSTAETNKKLPWNNFNYGEDIERLARAKYLGIKIIGGQKTKKKDFYVRNAPGLNVSIREGRYASGFSLALRLMQNLIDTERCYAYKSFSDFYNSADKKSKFRYFAFFVAYVIAKILGVYEYDKRLNNADYVLRET